MISALPFQSSLQSLDLPRCRARLRLPQVSALPLTELGSAAYQSSALLLCIAQLLFKAQACIDMNGLTWSIHEKVVSMHN